MISYSLLLRYALLYSAHSSVKMVRVAFDENKISGGLECTKFIPAATYILTASGSMSSDKFGKGGLSVILRSPGQRGPENERLILGPFRFANHECKPNCQVGFVEIVNMFSPSEQYRSPVD